MLTTKEIKNTSNYFNCGLKVTKFTDHKWPLKEISLKWLWIVGLTKIWISNTYQGLGPESLLISSVGLSSFSSETKKPNWNI